MNNLATAPDFTSYTYAEVAEFLSAHQYDVDASGITEAEVLSALATGRAALEVRKFGFALIQLTPLLNGKSRPHLWVMYVTPEFRGHKLGTKFVRELLKKYAGEYHMSLYCLGARRRKFFGKMGFVVESRDGEYRRMTTQKNYRS